MHDPTALANHRSRRIDLGVLAIIFVAGAFVTFVVRSGDPVIGSAQDDAIYMATAKAIADGRGYIHPELPSHPWQTKYPILYPLVLAAVWRAWPAFPDNVAAVQMLNGAFWIIGACFTYLSFRRGFGLHWSIAGGGVLVALTCYAVPGVAQTAFSESLYFCLSGVAIWCATPRRSETNVADESGAARPPREMSRAFLAGLTAAAAFLTRSIGVSLLFSVPVSFALRRKFAAATLSALSCIAAFAGWNAWRAWAAARNAENPVNAAFAYDLDYAAWLPREISAAAWVAANNIPEGLLSQTLFFIPPPFGWVVESISGGIGTASPIYAWMLIVGVLTVIGFVALVRHSNAVVPMYVAISGFLIVVWPFSPGRFLIPLFPLTVVMLLLGIERTIQGVTTVVRRVLEPPGDENDLHGAVKSNHTPPPRPSSARVSMLLALLGVFINARFLLTVPKGGRLAEAHRDRLEAAALISGHVDPDQAVYCNYNGFMHLMTDRWVIPYLPNQGSVPHIYPQDRNPLECGLTRPVSKSDYENRIVLNEWPRHFELTGASFAIAPNEDSTYGIAFQNLARTNPTMIRFVAESGSSRLYAIGRSE